MANGPIFLGNAYRPQFTVEHRTTDTGAYAFSTGLTLTILVTATDGSTTPIGSLTASASELSSTGGTYYTNFSATTVSSGLTTYEDQTVYVALVGTDIEVHEPVQVIDPRRPN